MSSLKELYGLAAAWLCLAAVGGLLAGGWWLWARPRRPLVPPQRFRSVPWGGAEVLGAILLVLFLVPSAVAVVFLTPKLIYRDYDSAGALKLWGPALGPLVNAMAIVLLFRFASGTRSFQLGLSGRRLGGDVVLGFLVWLVVTPLVYAVDAAATVANGLIQPGPVEPHPLLKELQDHPGLASWAAVVLAAVVGAPLFEELLFRGVLQPWLWQRSWGGFTALLGALFFGLNAGFEQAGKVFPPGDDPARWWETLAAFAPAAFVIAMIPGYAVADRTARRWLPYPRAGRTVYATALLFAATHSNVWPSPMPLFVLGLGLGYLAFRTQSIVGPIVAHALFNGMTCLALLVPFPRSG